MKKIGKIIVSKDLKTFDKQTGIHPLVFISKDKAAVMTHKPPIGVDFIKITNKDVYGLKIGEKQAYITSETYKTEGHQIGGLKKNFLKKNINKFQKWTK